METVLVTGAGGFLGQHLVNLLVEMGVPNIVAIGGRVRKPSAGRNPSSKVCHVYGDLNNTEFVKSIYLSKPDVIFHLAANPIVKMDEANPSQIIHDNVVVTNNLLAYAPKGCAFVNASSATVYGCEAEFEAEEDWPLRPISVYAATKVASEHLVNVYTSLSRVCGINLRMVANVGPGATHGLVKDVIEKLRRPQSHLELLGKNPGSVKPFVHVKDTASAFYLVAKKRLWNSEQAINISSNDSISVKQVACIVMEELGIAKPIAWLGDSANWKGDNPLVRVCPDLAVVNGWNPSCPSASKAVRQAVKDIVASEQR